MCYRADSALYECKITAKEMRNAYKILIGKPERKRPCRSVGVDGRVKLSLCLTKYHAMKTCPVLN